MACDPALEAELLASWDRMVRFYEDDFLVDDNWRWLTPMRDLVVQLREAGYDRSLRAGQSLMNFIVSRSRDHGMRDGQPSVMFQPARAQLTVSSTLGGGRKLKLAYSDEPDPQLLALLDELVAQPIT